MLSLRFAVLISLISELKSGQSGWWIIKVDRQSSEGAPPCASDMADYRNTAFAGKRNEILFKFIIHLMQSDLFFLLVCNYAHDTDENAAENQYKTFSSSITT